MDSLDLTSFCRTSLVCLVAAGTLLAADEVRNLAVVFSGGGESGEVRVQRGVLQNLRTGTGSGEARSQFRCVPSLECRIELRISGSAEPAAAGTTVMVAGTRHPFTFRLGDVDASYPIFLPDYGVVVTTADDRRSYREIAGAVRGRGTQTKLQKIENEPEESFAHAAAMDRQEKVQTWLGLSRDMRIFAVGERLDWIQPRFHGYEVPLPEAGDKPVRYNLLAGRGWGVRDAITRRLDDGVLPILHGRIEDESLVYDITAFAGLERGPLTSERLRGTHFLVADSYGHGHMFTPDQEAKLKSVMSGEMNQPEETVLYYRTVATNRGQTPAYALFKNPVPAGVRSSEWSYDGQNGFAVYKSGSVFAVSRLNGRPLAQDEIAVLLKPGEAATLDIFLPHRPIPKDRADRLSSQPFNTHLKAAQAFWQAKLDSAARVHLPEPRMDEMLRAGLLHLDLVTYGLEPKETLTATIGVYSAIGSESSPIIQFMDSMGWHDTARRSLMYFLDKQHENGFIQNFGGYMLETGAALWSIGEHYRYTNDKEWVRQIAPKLIKACEFLQQWRARNQREDLRGKGYGMLEGKTADPEDPFRSFMLNGYAYLGFARTAEMLADINPAQSRKWHEEAEGLKKDIRTAVSQVMSQSPVIPLGDGTWCPTLPPWVEYRGPLMLYTDGGNWFTHGAMTSRDSLLGPIYLIFQEVLDPSEPDATYILNFHSELMTDNNVAFSQPYYSRHPYVHLRRGEVKPFLKAWYNTPAALADRETYTFWEHFFHASPHKTHEEAWFLMESRWMLYMERGRTLELFPAIPRAYMEPGKKVELSRVASYFGPVSATLHALPREETIEATVDCSGPRKPASVEIRVPHPLGRKAVAVEGGTYNAVTERVRIDNFSGKAAIRVRF